MNTVHLRGIEVAYDDEGHGAPVIFLHGFPFNRSMWRAQIDFLSARACRLIAPDLRGLGESGRLQTIAGTDDAETRVEASQATMEEMARDVAALMDELKIGQAIICGLSMGAYVAFEFVHLFRARVLALVLAGARAEGPDEAEKASRQQQAQRVLSEGMTFAVDSVLRNLLAQDTFANKPEVVSQVCEMVLSTSPQGAAAAQRGMAMRRDYSEDLAVIEVPTLIIGGREDYVRKPADAEFIHQRIRNSHLKVIENAGHLMNIEQPGVFNELLIEFIRRQVS